MPKGEKSRAQAEERDREALARAGLKGERTPEEWVAHPTALDDLMRVLCGATLTTIERDRNLARDRCA